MSIDLVLLVEKLRSALSEHHAWHLSQTDPDPAHGFIPADEYSDSTMCVKTIQVLYEAECEIARRTGRPQPTD